MVFIPFVKLFKVYVICNDRDKIDILLKNIEKQGVSAMVRHERGKESAYGIALGPNFAAYIFENEKGKETDVCVYLCASPAAFKGLMTSASTTATSSNEEAKAEKTLTMFVREGRYDWFYYRSRDVNIARLAARKEQQEMIELIVENFQSRSRKMTVFLHGSKGAGKTTLVKLVAARLGARLCKTHNPTDAGDTIASMLRDTEPTAERPLVLLLDEADALFRRVHDKRVVHHRNVPVPVHDKASMNGYLDDFEDIDNVLLVMVSNETRETIDGLDSSYIREGRVHMYLTL